MLVLGWILLVWGASGQVDLEAVHEDEAAKWFAVAP